MSTYRSEEAEFLSALQKFTVHCMSYQCSSKIESYCLNLLTAVKQLPQLYLGHKIQLALALESASIRNDARLILNDHMNIISHLILLCRPNLDLNEESICQQWSAIDLTNLLDECEKRFKQQTYSSTIWIQIFNETSIVGHCMNITETNLFSVVQHDTDVEQLLQWLNDRNTIEIPGRLNRTYFGVPLFWCTPLSSESHSKYGAVRLIFSFSLVYSPEKHHLFDLGQRMNGFELWNNVLVTKRTHIAGYGTNFTELISIPSLPVDIAIDLTDGPLLLSQVYITFVDHIHRCVYTLPNKLTSQHSCYHTCHSAMEYFVDQLRHSGKCTLDAISHLFDSCIFENLKQINRALSSKEVTKQ